MKDLNCQAALQLADRALSSLRGTSATSPPHSSRPSAMPTPASPLPSRSSTPVRTPPPRHGPDPVERDFRNSSLLLPTIHGATLPNSRDIQNFVASREVETDHQAKPRRRRDQGHLFSHSTVGESSPPQTSPLRHTGSVAVSQPTLDPPPTEITRCASGLPHSPIVHAPSAIPTPPQSSTING